MKNDFKTAESVCVLADTPCAKVVKSAVEHRNFSERDLKEFIQSKLDLAVPEFENNLSALNTISNVSTLLGLLGTVTGNIKAFGVLGNGGTMGDPALLAGAIAEALVTTVAGLVVAIPAIIFSSYFNSQVNHSITRMEQTVTSVLFRLTKKARLKMKVSARKKQTRWLICLLCLMLFFSSFCFFSFHNIQFASCDKC